MELGIGRKVALVAASGRGLGLAEPEEPAAAAAFLASELAGYITGVSLLVDGGAVRAL